MACGQAIGVAVEITVWQMRPMFTVGLQIDDHRRSGTAFDQATTGGIRQHRHRAAIGVHIGQPLRRIGRIQRHIRTTGLEHRQHRHHHLHTTLHTDRHAIIRAHTQSAQVMCPPIGSRIQLGIRQRHLTLHHRDGRWITYHLRLEQLVHTGIARIIRRRCIPLHQHLMPLGLVQQRQTIHRHIFGTLGHHRRQQTTPMPHPSLHGRTLEKRRIKIQSKNYLIFAFNRFHDKIKRCRTSNRRTTEMSKMQTTPRYRCKIVIIHQNIQRIRRAARILKHKHCLKKWRTTFLARRIESSHKLGKWKILVLHCSPDTITHDAQQFPDGKVRIKISA